MEYSKINSNTIIAKVHKDSFTNEITEVEKIAEEIGIYGKVLSYRIANDGIFSNIIFKVS